MKKIFFVFALLCIIFAFTGCASDEVPDEEPLQNLVDPGNGQGETTNDENDQKSVTNDISDDVTDDVTDNSEPEIEPVVEVFPNPEPVAEPFTMDWQDIVVDDEENCGYFITTDELGTFSSIEGEFKKDAGNESSCFGFVFGYSGQEEGIVPDYLRFAINVKGEYSIHSWNKDGYKDLIDPEADTAYLYKTDTLKQGYGEVNTLKVEIDEEGLLTFFINDTEVASKIEPFENSTCGVMVFFSIGTKAEENLAENPVKFSYAITDSASVETIPSVIQE